MAFRNDIILHLKTHILRTKVKMGSYEKMPTMFTLEEAKKAQRGGTGIALLSL